MIIFDASYLVVYLNKNPEPAKDRDGKPVSHFKERVEYLATSLSSSEPIGIPTPAMAEVLVRAGKGRAQFVSILSDRMRFQIVPFDARAAIEAAELIALVKSNNETWGTHAKVKFDIQIVATAKAEDARLIYSDDRDVENFAKRLKIPVLRICDLPLPPSPEPPKVDEAPIGKQSELFGAVQPELPLNNPIPGEISSDGKSASESAAETDKGSDEHKTNPAHPTAVRGSDKGRVEGEAAGETAIAPAQTEATEEPKAASDGGLGESGS
jgi:predicted nucleic acid-binding protein